MEGLLLDGWDGFFGACAGAAAALAGLLFVAVSINLAKILAIPGQAERAGEALLPLSSVLVMSLAALAPGLTQGRFAVVAIVCGGFAWVAVTLIEVGALRRHHFVRRFHVVIRMAFGQSSTVPVWLSGLAVLLHVPGGMYWILPGILATFTGALVNSWILLVEILR
ncbi:MAG TPA: hypothetical protein VGG37_05900 [Opitutaceae bacterium]|jgi:modulator of FtsH protease